MLYLTAMPYLLILCCCLFLSTANAQSRSAWSAIWDPYLLPIGTAPITTGCSLDTGFRIANYLSYNQGTWGNINTDLETWQLRVGASIATDYGEFSASIPLTLAWTGILDPVLNLVHRVLNVGVSPEPALDEIRYTINAGGNTRSISGTRFGIGDANLSWAYTLEPVWTRITLGIPTGDSTRWLGAGGWRIQFAIALEQPLYSLAFAVLIPLSKIAILEDFQQQISLQALLRWQLPWELPGSLEFLASTSPAQIGGQFAALTIAIRILWQNDSIGTISFNEDFMPTLPDVVLAWDKRFLLPCELR